MVARHQVTLLAVLTAGAWTPGCGDAGHCPRVDGTFDPVYTEVAGTCGPIEDPDSVPFDSGRYDTWDPIGPPGGPNVTTEVVLAGCELRMTQIITDPEGRLLSQIHGETLQIESDSLVTGQVSVARYDSTGATTCTGSYDIVLTAADGPT